jgi:hypothetical protein
MIKSGKGLIRPLKLKVYVPSCADPETPISIMVRPEATVEQVIGYALFEYIDQSIEPELEENAYDVKDWHIRIAEDDGMVDDDFPPLDRNRRIESYSCRYVALIFVPPPENPLGAAGSAKSSNSLMANPTPNNPASNVPAAPVLCFLKIHLYSTLEVQQSTTMPAMSNLLMSEIFESICKKRNYDPKQYIMKLGDTKTDVAMDKTLEQIGAIEFCILKKDRGGGRTRVDIYTG